MNTRVLYDNDDDEDNNTRPTERVHPLGGDKVSMLTHRPTYPHKPLRKIEVTIHNRSPG